MISKHLPNIKGLIIDMDGVLWNDTQPIGDLPAIFQKISDSGYQFILATNNATKSIDEYHQKLQGFGVKLEDWQVINSAMAAGIFLKQKYPQGARIHVVGQPGLKKTLSELGFQIVSEDETRVDIVVASLDFNLTYEKLKHAALLIRNGAYFIGTNLDPTLPTPEGFIPGSGTVVRALETATESKAKVIGKPEPDLYLIAMQRLQLSPEETLAIGDRLDTDIAGAQAAGIRTALVLSGASTREEALIFQPNPDIIANDLTDLIF